MGSIVRLLVCSLYCVALLGCGGGGSDVRLVNISATLSWDAPTTNVDGTPVDLQGYRIYYRPANGGYAVPVDVGNVTQYVVNVSGVPSGTYYFAVTAYDSQGNESDYSSEAGKSFL